MIRPSFTMGTHSLNQIVAEVAHLLPAQGPIGVFIHHNTLHAFEHLPFEEAVQVAGRILGCEPFLSQERFREEYGKGRIRPADLEAVLRADLGAGHDEILPGGVTRGNLRRLMLVPGLVPGPDPEVRWLLEETGVLDDAGSRRLFQACLNLLSQAPPSVPTAHGAAVGDPAVERAAQELVGPLLIRTCAAYLDQGIAQVPAPGRYLAFYPWFLKLQAQPQGPQPEGWRRRLHVLCAHEWSEGLDVWNSLQRSLGELGIDPAHGEDYLARVTLPLRGWAGMFHQFEERPDRAPFHAPPARFVDFLAVRLLCQRAAAPETDATAPQTSPASPSREAQVWPLFQMAQILFLDAAALAALGPEGAARLRREIEDFDDLARRRVFHLAYERAHRHQMLDALALHRPTPTPAEPLFQAIFCIDEREESLRRYLEELHSPCVTYGAPGFFGVAMYYRGLGEAHERPLCPIAIRPAHRVIEVERRSGGRGATLRLRSRQTIGRLSERIAEGSRHPLLGSLIAALLGALYALPLLLRVVFPRLAALAQARGRRVVGPTHRTRLRLRREGGEAVQPAEGYTAAEMAAIVQSILENIGLTRAWSPLILVIGHGSSSLNNPHESAHDCGACGGGRGGPNARAFAQMANDTEVRRMLAKEGLTIPGSTWFLGAQHNTCDDALLYYDLDLLPAASRNAFETARTALERARRRDAQERCRRYETAAPRIGHDAALEHVEARGEDLAQPRPEYGHATNAVCIVGRRERTRGLYLDRRAFLQSYDPLTDDDQASILGRVLDAVIPVVAGISLEYYFSFVDPTGYGCGTKLPHNITCLLGVMDGHASDLRTGLPWQMVEIHEPVRLVTVIETTHEPFLRLLDRQPRWLPLAQKRWFQLITLDPLSAQLWEWVDGREPRPYRPEAPELPRAARSIEWFRTHREHLPPCQIHPAA